MSEHWVCIGHSHVAAFVKAMDADLDAINFWDTGDPWVELDGATRLRDDIAERVAKGRLVLASVGGSAHNLLGAVEHTRPFDFILPSDPELPLDPSREIVPVDAVRAKLMEMSLTYLEKLPAIVRAAQAMVIQLAPPPPVADNELVGSRLPWFYYPDQPRIVAPKWLRFKVWRLYCEVIGDACTQYGVGLAPRPADAVDDEGFLRPEFNEDGAHANGAYGELVLKTLRQAA